MPFVAPKFEDIKKLTPLQNYMADVLTVGPNLAGLPHMTLPVGKANNMPVGLMLIGDHLMEEKIIQVGARLE
jgi:aspartyl-tRNA(Asn)/glutamyl-tRNA(Gln) amidotransferase subunit A